MGSQTIDGCPDWRVTCNVNQRLRGHWLLKVGEHLCCRLHKLTNDIGLHRAQRMLSLCPTVHQPCLKIDIVSPQILPAKAQKEISYLCGYLLLFGVQGCSSHCLQLGRKIFSYLIRTANTLSTWGKLLLFQSPALSPCLSLLSSTICFSFTENYTFNIFR